MLRGWRDEGDGTQEVREARRGCAGPTHGLGYAQGQVTLMRAPDRMQAQVVVLNGALQPWPWATC